MKWFSLFSGLIVISLTSSSATSPSGELFTSSFLVKFKRSIDNQLAHDIANRNGFHNIGPVSYEHLIRIFIFTLFIQFIIILQSHLSASCKNTLYVYFVIEFTNPLPPRKNKGGQQCH